MRRRSPGARYVAASGTSGAAGGAAGSARNARARVGVLSLQGDFARHMEALSDLGVEPVRVSLPEHLHDLAALVLPGGESSTMLRLLDSTGLRAPLESYVRDRPVFGTCAGLILLAKSADKLPHPTLGVIDVTAVRNAWGRQVHSFQASVHVSPLGHDVQGVFIRAPRVTRVGRTVQVIARHGGEPVGVRKGRSVAVAFHPELTADRSLHAWFLREVAGVPVAAGVRSGAGR